MVALHFNAVGGLEQYSRELAEVCSKLGNDVEVISVFESKGSFIDSGIRINSFMPRRKTAKRLFFRLWPIALFLYLLKKSPSFDLVIALHPKTTLEVYALHKLMPSKRYIVCTYGTDVWFDWPFLMRKGMENAERIITISEYTKSVIARNLRKEVEITMLPPSVDTESFFPEERRSQRSDEAVLLTVCRLGELNRYKGYDKVIQALPDVERRLKRKICYRIVGSGSDDMFIEQLASRNKERIHVETINNASFKELVKEYQGCDLFILPSRMEQSGKKYLDGEGFGIVYIEAAACGKPVVGSKQGGAPDAIINGKTGYLVDPIDVKEIADAVCSILEDPEAAENMGVEGRSFVIRNFSRELFQERVAALLDGVIICAG